MFNRDSNNRGGFAPRQMVQGNWKCANANNTGNPCPNGPDFVITEMPFEPSPDRPIYCRDCWKRQRDERGPRQNRY